VKSLLLLLACATTAHAEVDTCPVTTHDEHFLDNIVKAMKGKSCDDAAAIAEKCALGASGDVATAGAASKICQADHPKSDKTLFENLAKRCVAKYANKQGTMYQSAAAFCELQIAVLLSDLNRKAD
jgi:hypothetical protein